MYTRSTANAEEIQQSKHDKPARSGKRQTLETLIAEATLLLAKYLRNKMQDWNPRIPQIKIVLVLFCLSNVRYF